LFVRNLLLHPLGGAWPRAARIGAGKAAKLRGLASIGWGTRTARHGSRGADRAAAARRVGRGSRGAANVKKWPGA